MSRFTFSLPAIVLLSACGGSNLEPLPNDLLPSGSVNAGSERVSLPETQD